MAASDQTSTGAEVVRAEALMAEAIETATATHPHPNPRVGALIVDASGRIVAEAAHEGPGRPHAEVTAIERAGDAARGATLVVTLEPCDHTGRTGPCTELILGAGVSRVIFGSLDPDAKVRGAGKARLAEAGVEVIDGVLADAVVAMDPGYHHHRQTGRPRVTLKLAGTLDGQVAAADGTSQWITGREARADVHRLRAESDAVMIGAGTLRIDDPRLDVRLDGYDGRQPLPVVVAGRQPLPEDAAVYARSPIIFAPQRLEPPPDAELVMMWHPTGVDLEGMMKELGARGVVDLLVEGGPSLAAALLAARLVDRLVVYHGAALAGGVGAPMFTGEFSTLDAATRLEIAAVRRIGPDIRIDATPVWGTD